jgi:hypothetical protein
MRKKLTLMVLFLSIFLLIGCTDKNKEKEKKKKPSEDVGNYTGVYKHDDCVIKAYQKEYDLKYTFKCGDITSENSIYLESRTIKDGVFKFVFSDEKIKVTVNAKNTSFDSGEYIKTEDYTYDEVYDDFIGVSELFDNNYNGKYTNEENTIYIVQTDRENIRFVANLSSNKINTEVTVTKEGNYRIEYYGSVIFITFNSNDSLTLKIDSKNSEMSKLSGSYSKNSTLTKEEAVKIFLD